MEPNQQNKESVLVLEDKNKTKLDIVSSIDKQGNVQTVVPKESNQNQFLKITNDGMLKNFMSNFLRQYNDPSHFGLYKLVNNQVEASVEILKSMLKRPDVPENEETIEGYSVKFDEFSVSKGFTPLDESRINWKEFEAVGVTRENLSESGDLQEMLAWRKSPNLIPLTIELGEATVRTEARLGLRENEKGEINLAIYAIRHEPELDRPYMNVRFTDEDKENLRNTGNLGRQVELSPTPDNKFNAFVSIDKLTNELIAVRADRIRIPDKLLGVELSRKQQSDLAEGKAVRLEGMTSRNGKEFAATLQINADKKGLDFMFDNTPKFSERQMQTVNQNEQPNGEKNIPKTLCGLELSEKQQHALNDGRTLYLKNMTDKKGEPFNAYVKYSEEEQRPRFYKWNPDKEKTVAVAEESKTQVEVNNEGKTNEATKNIKEPLKKNQVKPTEKQNSIQDKKEERPKQSKPKKRGVKI